MPRMWRDALSVMTNCEFPALQSAADAAADSAQSRLLAFYKGYSALLIIASVVAMVGATNKGWAILSAVLFLGSLAVYVYGRTQRLQAKWYQARALAESIKSASWRLMMGADPFSNSNEQANLNAFRSLLTELLQQNAGIAEQLGGSLSVGDQVTSWMKGVMRSSFSEKNQLYFQARVLDQRTWYSTKSADNKKWSQHNFIAVALAYCIAVVLVLIRVSEPSLAPFLPIEVLAVVASALIGWAQLRRFDDLNSSYALTAHEVGIIQAQCDDVNDQASLSKFVADAENAFSR